MHIWNLLTQVLYAKGFKIDYDVSDSGEVSLLILS